MTDTPDPINALLGAGPRRPMPLPPPNERVRLRTEYGLTKAETAKALGVSASSLTAWESGQREPQGEARAAYAKLLEGIAAQLAPAQPASAVPAPVVPEAYAAPAPQPVMLDQNPDGSLLMAPPAPCVRCGNPSVYRAQGHPMHLGGFCRPAASAPAVPAAPVPMAAAPVVQQIAEPALTTAPVPTAVPRRSAPVAGPMAAPRRASSSRPASSSRARKAPAKAAAKAEGPSDWEAAAAARFPAGPLAVLDVAKDGKSLVAYLADGTVAPTAPAGRTLADVVEWALETKLGSPRLHRHGKDGDALVVLTDAALTDLGLPPMGRDEKRDFVQRLGQLPKTHKAVKQVEKAGWQLTQRGLGPWARIFRTPEDGKRVCVQLCIPAWGALTSGGWQIPDGLGAPDLARLLGTYATRVLTPRGSTAVSGLELVTALRPPTRAVRTEAGWTSGPVEGSRPPKGFDPAPPEVPDVHPLAQDRAPADELVTEAWDWFRELTEDEKRTALYGVGLDVNMAFLAAAGRLTLPLGPPVHELNPTFDKRIPGSWLADLSHVATDPLLPSPFTADGSRPTGPAWYSTVKLAYALELGATVQPTEAYLRPEHGPYLDPWHKRLRAAYLDTMAALGVPLDLADRDPLAFLDAMTALKTTGDPAELAVLTAIKQTAKGTIGKMRERPRGHGYKPGERWPALDR
ncbi:telomere-associated protein Tap, partial [Kitasatospora sp. NPDC001175]